MLGRSTLRRPADWWPGFALALVIVASFVILVLIAVILWLGFRVGPPGDPNAAYSLVNYDDAFGDPLIYQVLLNTCGFSSVTLIVALAYGLPLAWLVERTDLGGKTVLLTSMTIGLLLPGFAAAMGWLFLLHPRIGLLNTAMMDFFGSGAATLNIATIGGMGWVQGLSLAPVAFVMTAAVFRSLDPALEEAAQMAGANPRKIMWSITLKLAWPGILAASIYIFTIGFAAFDVPAIIGWSNRLFTFSTYLLLRLSPTNGLPRYDAVAALSSFLIVLALIMSWWYGRMQRRAHRYQVVTGKAYRPITIALGRKAWWAWGFAGSYILLSNVVPIVVVAWASLLPYFQLPTVAAFKSISLAQYRALPWDLLFAGLINSVKLMVITPTVTLGLSLAFSWVVLRSGVRGRNGFDLIAFLPHAIPNIVFGVSVLLVTLFVVPAAAPILDTIWVLLFVFVVARLSYGTRMTNSGFIQLHRELEEAAKISGADAGLVMWKIVMPLLAPTLFYAWLWIALLTFRELTLAVVLTTRGNLTLPVVVWSSWLNGGLAQASAFAMLMLLVMSPIIMAYWLFARRRGIVAHS